jgi:Tol biopolymer transport system component
VNNEDGIWAVDPAVGFASQVALYPTNNLALDNRVRSNMVDFDAAGRAYFVFEASDGSFTLYRVDDDGMNLEAVPGTNLMNGDGAASVVSFGINDDGDQVAFAADSPQAGVFEVWVVGTAQMTAERVSDVSPSVLSDTGPVATHPIVWSPDGTQLAVISDWIVGGSVSADNWVWLVPSTTPAGGTRILGPDANNNAQDATGVDFSADGTRLFVLGDLVTNNDDELYQTDDLTTADQDPSAALLQGAPANGDVADFVTDR